MNVLLSRRYIAVAQVVSVLLLLCMGLLWQVPVQAQSSHGDMVGAINQMRAEAGVHGLNARGELNAIAQVLSDAQARGEYIADMTGLFNQYGYAPGSTSTLAALTYGVDAHAIRTQLSSNASLYPMVVNPSHTDIGLAYTEGTPGYFYVSVIMSSEAGHTTPAVTSPGVPAPVAPESVADQAGAIIAMVNDLRVSQGLNPLNYHPTLTNIAAGHSNDQAAMDVMSHTGSDGSQIWDRGVRGGYHQWVGENVLMRHNLDARGAFEQWLYSPSHYQNMLHPTYVNIGVAYAVSASGRYYYTMVLGFSESYGQ